MGMHPIDLQTLYTRLDQVGKQQSAQQQVAALQQADATATAAKKQEQVDSVVKQSSALQDDSERITDKDGSSASPDFQGEGKKRQADSNEQNNDDRPRWKAPSTGVFIDIDG